MSWLAWCRKSRAWYGCFPHPEAHCSVAGGRKSGRLLVEMSLNEHVNQERCHLAFDYDTELTTSTGTDKNKTSLPPDGNIITGDVDIFYCAEICFQPSHTGKEASGSATLLSSVMKCDVDIRRHFVLSGATTMFQVIVERTTKSSRRCFIHDEDQGVAASRCFFFFLTPARELSQQNRICHLTFVFSQCSLSFPRFQIFFGLFEGS